MTAARHLVKRVLRWLWTGIDCLRLRPGKRPTVGIRMPARYRSVRHIASGGMGQIFAAEDRALERPVAIKLSALDTPSGRELFQREAHNAARLCHPNIVTVYDCGETLDGQPYYTMELVDGLTLRELVASTGRQPPARVAHILAQLADALTETIEHGMIHGDVKPANVMLCRAGRRHDLIKLLDFGVMTKLGNEPVAGSRKTLMGTAAYLAPELVHGATPDEYSEMYSLGLVGYYLLTGTHPFAANAAGTLANAQGRNAHAQGHQ